MNYNEFSKALESLTVEERDILLKVIWYEKISYECNNRIRISSRIWIWE